MAEQSSPQQAPQDAARGDSPTAHAVPTGLAAPAVPLNPSERPRHRECNSMSFVDDQGARHKIYLRRGTMKEACRLFMDKNWEELKKFPAWTNAPDQQYTEDDWIYEDEEERGITSGY